jgi:hypothetical protein
MEHINRLFFKEKLKSVFCLFILYGFLFQSALAQYDEFTQTFSLAEYPVFHAIQPLKGLIEDIFPLSDQAVITEIITKEVALLPYSDKLKEKILIAFSKVLLEENQKILSTEYMSEYMYYNLGKFLSFSFNLTDLSELIGIQREVEIINTIDIEKYNQQHFASEYDVDNITQITQNNFTLYHNWRQRLTQNINENGLYDFNVPELETVYLYLKAGIESYQQVFDNPLFQDFLEARTAAMNSSSPRTFVLDEFHKYQDLKSFMEGVLEKAKSFKNLTTHEEEVTPRSLSYLKFLEMDQLLRVLVDSILPPSSRFSLALGSAYNAGYQTALDFMKENLFFIPHIGATPGIAFLNTLATPLLHIFDLSVSLMPSDKTIVSLEVRRDHDYVHSLSIQRSYLMDNLMYHSTENLSDTKALFLIFLRSLQDHFNRDVFKQLIQDLIYQHHESPYANYPTDFQFMRLFLNKASERLNIENLLKIKGNLIPAWVKVVLDFYHDRIDHIHEIKE